jgi:hypothetical protein
MEDQSVLGNSDEVSVMRARRRGAAMRCQGLEMCYYLENGQVETVSTVLGSRSNSHSTSGRADGPMAVRAG